MYLYMLGVVIHTDRIFIYQMLYLVCHLYETVFGKKSFVYDECMDKCIVLWDLCIGNIITFSISHLRLMILRWVLNPYQ